MIDDMDPWSGEWVRVFVYQPEPIDEPNRGGTAWPIKDYRRTRYTCSSGDTGEPGDTPRPCEPSAEPTQSARPATSD